MAIRNPGEHGFDRLYGEHSVLVYNYLRRRLRSDSDAEDATVETFRRVHSGIKKFRGECSEKVWVMRIATNVAYRSMQKEAKHRYVSLDDMGPAEAERLSAALGSTVESEVANRSLVEGLLASLPDVQRAAVWLRVGIEYTDEEVAQILDVPVGTVKSWVWRSLARLRKTCAGLEQEVLTQ